MSTHAIHQLMNPANSSEGLVSRETSILSSTEAADALDIAPADSVLPLLAVISDSTTAPGPAYEERTI